MPDQIPEEVKLFTSALKAFQGNNRKIMAQRKHLDDFLRGGRIIGRLERGSTQLEVSEVLGIAQSVISRLWQRFQDDGNVSRCYSTGRPRVTKPNEDRYLAVTAKRNRRSTASDLSRQLFSATGTTVSMQTVYRRLGHIGLYARRPVRCVPLTATHCRLRLTWSREHVLWAPQQWSCVMFSDESRFSLQSGSRRTLIWREPGTRYHQENTIERHRYGGAGWPVWGGIILGSRTDLHVQSVTMTGHIYRDVILEQHVRLFLGAEFLFMDDNARPHHANIIDECLQSEDITRMDWPAYSPDLNPIEHVWDMLGRRIAARQPPPTCLPELRRALLDEWCNIRQDQIDNLILSMLGRFVVTYATRARLRQIQVQEIHHGKGIDVRLSLAVDLSTMQERKSHTIRVTQDNMTTEQGERMTDSASTSVFQKTKDSFFTQRDISLHNDLLLRRSPNFPRHDAS
ncbi:transposable element Tcb2 transposase [Trichonephila clavipes]|nr:transposable element Tcb2 transposase [Trichonephila clavipes]